MHHGIVVTLNLRHLAAGYGRRHAIPGSSCRPIRRPSGWRGRANTILFLSPLEASGVTLEDLEKRDLLMPRYVFETIETMQKHLRG